MTTLTLSASTLLCDGQYWYSSDIIIKIQFVSWPGWHCLIDPSYHQHRDLLWWWWWFTEQKYLYLDQEKYFNLNYHDKWCHCIRNINFISTNCSAGSRWWWPVDWCTPGRCQWCTLYTVHCTMHGKSLSWLLQVEVVTCDHSLQSVKVSWKC